MSEIVGENEGPVAAAAGESSQREMLADKDIIIVSDQQKPAQDKGD